MPDLDTLEARLEADRAALVQSLDALTASLSPDRVKNEISSTVQACGGELGSQVWRAARDNTAAFSLVGAGLGLLLTGVGKRSTPSNTTGQARDPKAAMIGFDDRVRKADMALKEKEITAMTSTHSKASRLRAALDSGLDKLPEASRQRVIKAREAAAEAQEKVEAQAARLARKTSTFAYEHPLAAGALGLGVGALIGALLPSSRSEDQMLGAQRDAMMQRAKDALQQELETLSTSAQEKLNRRTG